MPRKGKIEIALPEAYIEYLNKAAADVERFEGGRIYIDHENTYPSPEQPDLMLYNFVITYDQVKSLFFFGHYLGVNGMYEKSVDWKAKEFHRLLRKDFKVS